MRGGYVHNCVLLDRIVQDALRAHAEVDREIPILVGQRLFYGDLLIRKGSRLILVEVELSSKRVSNDTAKAVALRACELWIVVPNPRVARAVKRSLLRQPTAPGTLGLFVLTLPQALQRLEGMFFLNSGPNSSIGKEKTKRVDE